MQFKTRKRTTDPQKSLITCPKTLWTFWARRTRSKILSNEVFFFLNIFQVSNWIVLFLRIITNSLTICTDKCRKIECITFSVSWLYALMIELTFSKISYKYKTIIDWKRIVAESSLFFNYLFVAGSLTEIIPPKLPNIKSPTDLPLFF